MCTGTKLIKTHIRTRTQYKYVYVHVNMYVDTELKRNYACVHGHMLRMYPPPHMTCMYPPPHMTRINTSVITHACMDPLAYRFRDLLAYLGSMLSTHT